MKRILKKVFRRLQKITLKLRSHGIVNWKLVISRNDNLPIWILKLSKLFFNYYEPVLYVGCNEKFKHIQDAVDYAKDTSKYKVTIKVSEGTYEKVSVRGKRNISIIGCNKSKCIIRDDSGQYLNAPLEIEGNCLVKNLTIISTHDKDNITPVDKLRGYAVHADWNGQGVSEFNNCIFISYQNASFGCGLHQNQTVKLIDCELYSHTPSESSMIKNGALFCHNELSNNTTNQHLIVSGCKIESDSSYTAYINDCNKELGKDNFSEMDVTFMNSVLYSKELGTIGIINKEEKDNNLCYSGQIKLSSLSKGNNLDEFNILK